MSALNHQIEAEDIMTNFEGYLRITVYLLGVIALAPYIAGRV